MLAANTLSMGRAAMSRLALLSLLGCWGLYLSSSFAEASDSYQFRHEQVLGTSCEINVWATSKAEAERAESTVLAEIDRLQHIFSTHQPHSELMRWQRGEITGQQLSPELLKVLERAEFWRVSSGGAFDGRVGELTKLWKQAALEQRLPDAAQLMTICQSLRSAPYAIHDSKLQFRHDAHLISLDAIAKGYILDLACERAQREHAFLASPPGGLSVMIGGDMRMVGAASQTISIANPFEAGEGAQPIATVQLARSMGLATSGGYRRYHENQWLEVLAHHRSAHWPIGVRCCIRNSDRTMRYGCRCGRHCRECAWAQ